MSALRTMGNLRCSVICVLGIGRKDVPCHGTILTRTIRRRQELFCMKVAETGGGLILTCIGHRCRGRQRPSQFLRRANL